MPGQTEPSPHVHNCEHQPSLGEAGKRAWVNVNYKELYKVQSLAEVEGTSMRTVQCWYRIGSPPSAAFLSEPHLGGDSSKAAVRGGGGDKALQGTQPGAPRGLLLPAASSPPPKAAQALCEALQKADNWPPLLYCRTSSDYQAGKAETSRGRLPGPYQLGRTRRGSSACWGSASQEIPQERRPGCFAGPATLQT